MLTRGACSDGGRNLHKHRGAALDGFHQGWRARQAGWRPERQARDALPAQASSVIAGRRGKPVADAFLEARKCELLLQHRSAWGGMRSMGRASPEVLPAGPGMMHLFRAQPARAPGVRPALTSLRRPSVPCHAPGGCLGLVGPFQRPGCGVSRRLRHPPGGPPPERPRWLPVGMQGGAGQERWVRGPQAQPNACTS